MPVSLFQTDQFRIRLQELPDQRLKFYLRVENELKSIYEAILKKTDSISNIRGRLMQLRFALTAQLAATGGVPLA
jgi:hypothetical protein